MSHNYFLNLKIKNMLTCYPILYSITFATYSSIYYGISCLKKYKISIEKFTNYTFSINV